jgi:hypothetical protein
MCFQATRPGDRASGGKPCLGYLDGLYTLSSLCEQSNIKTEYAFTSSKKRMLCGKLGEKSPNLPHSETSLLCI